jgi:hypothetical protein
MHEGALLMREDRWGRYHLRLSDGTRQDSYLRFPIVTELRERRFT